MLGIFLKTFPKRPLPKDNFLSGNFPNVQFTESALVAALGPLAWEVAFRKMSLGKYRASQIIKDYLLDLTLKYAHKTQKT